MRGEEGRGGAGDFLCKSELDRPFVCLFFSLTLIKPLLYAT